MTADEEWARQLLSRLPEPRMPDEVRGRLAAAIAQESARTAEAGPAAVVPLQRQRGSRRRPLFAGLIGAAAALTLFAVFDPLATPGHEESDSTIAGEADSESGQAPTPSSGAPSDAGAAVLLATDTPYSRADLEAQVQQTALRAEARALAPGSPTPNTAETVPPGAGSEGTPVAGLAAAEDCAAAIPDPKGTLAFIDRADFEGEPALIVAFRSDDQLDVVVLQESCTLIDPEVQYRVTVEAPRSLGE